MMKIVPSLAALLLLSACAAEEEEESELIFKQELLVSQGLPDIEYSNEHSAFAAKWQCFFSFDGALEDAPDPNSEEIDGLRFSPILFYPKETFLAVTTRHERLDNKQLTRLSFFCVPRGDHPIVLQPGHIYVFDSERREILKIGRFSSEASPAEVRDVAKRTLKQSLEQQDEALKP